MESLSAAQLPRRQIDMGAYTKYTEQELKSEIDKSDQLRVELERTLEELHEELAWRKIISSRQAELSSLMTSAGFSAEAIEAALAVQYGVSKIAEPATTQAAESSDKPTAESLGSVFEHMDHEGQTHRELALVSGVAGRLLTNTLTCLLAGGKIVKEGERRGTRYSRPARQDSMEFVAQ